jgi:two-component system osmolarity sensor histidine kinase EnvZ
MMPALHPFRALKRALPRGLFGRSLIIIVAPMVMLQGIVTYAFFVRHYDIMTRAWRHGVAADVAFLISIEESYPPGKARAQSARHGGAQSRLSDHAPARTTSRHAAPPHSTDLKDAMNACSRTSWARPTVHVAQIGRYVDLKVQVKDGVLRVMIPRERMVASNADIFILWMVGSSLVLIAVAIMFLRNQVRPIERLALAAEAFGKGRAVPDFKPYGAAEVRRAAQAFSPCANASSAMCSSARKCWRA